MNIIDPILANFKNITGSFPEATGHYSKKFNELEDMYENKLMLVVDHSLRIILPNSVLRLSAAQSQPLGRLCNFRA